MATFRNQDVHTRTWIGLQRPDGRTLELDPGEEVELELPDDFTDVHLQAKRRSRRDIAETVDPTPPPPSDAGSSDVAVTTEQES